MKKTVFAFLSFILLCGCKKDSVDNIKIGTIKVEIGGTDYTFSVRSKATRLPVSGGFGVEIQGDYKTNSSTNLSFSIVRPSAITVGTYVENGGGNSLVRMIHCIELLIPCVTRAINYRSPSDPVTITITDITSSYVKGTFKGELQTGAGSKEKLKNGMFYVGF